MPEKNRADDSSAFLVTAELIEKARTNPNLTTLQAAAESLADSLRLMDAVLGKLISLTPPEDAP